MSWLHNLPAHRFLRNPNYNSTLLNRAWSRSNPFDNNLVLLTDPKTGRKVYLIGTTHSSTALASRTQKLIEAVKPDSVHVSACNDWYERVSRLNLQNQEQLNNVNSDLNDLLLKHVVGKQNNARGIYFKLRFLLWAAFTNLNFAFPADFNGWRPGVEALWAVEAAKRTGAKVNFLGGVFNKYLVEKLYLENNFTVLRPLWRSLRGEKFATWRRETDDFWNVLRSVGGAGFAENLDQKGVSWFVNWFERYHPEAKAAFVDKEDERIYKDLANDPSKVIVAVVNHWHLPGVRSHWERSTGTEPVREPINPIGDFNIDEIQEAGVIGDALRAIFSERSKTEPASWSNYLTHYHKCVMEPERERHVFFDGHDDHHLDHGLFNQENAHVEGHGHQHAVTDGKH